MFSSRKRSAASTVKNEFDALRAEAGLLYKQCEYEKSLDTYNKALEIQPLDKTCLVSRSKCYLQLGNAEQALSDAETVLEQDRGYVRALYQKAESLYQLGNFEMSLVFFHRGNKLRPEMQEFRLGIQKSQEAIHNSIGDPSSVKLESKGDLTSFYNQDEPKQAGNRKPISNKQPLSKIPGGTKTIKQLLGELYADREYLEKLLQDEDTRVADPLYCYTCFSLPRLCRCVKPGKVRKLSVPEYSSPLRKNHNRSKTEDLAAARGSDKVSIHKLAREGLQYLDSRTEFWRQQKPMYARKREKQRQDASSKKIDPAKYILKSLDEIEQAQTNGDYKGSLVKAKKSMKQVSNWADQDFPNKTDIIATLHSCMGNAYIEMQDYDRAMDHYQRDYDIALEHKLEDAKSRAMDNLGRVYARIGEYDKAVKIWEEKIPLCKTALEKTWLYHEVGRCYLELEMYTKSKDYGEKSLFNAQEADDAMWQLNASVLIGQSEVKMGEYQSATSSFERSLEMARIQGDTAAEKAIKKAIEDLNEKIVHGIKDESNNQQTNEAFDARTKSVNSRENSPERNSPESIEHEGEENTKGKNKVEGDTNDDGDNDDDQ